MISRVFIAGPYTKEDVAFNVKRAMEAWHYLYDAGYVPYCPHLTHFLHMHKNRPYQQWLEYDKEWLKLCHYVLRLPGESGGADGEVIYATALGIETFEGTPEEFVNKYGRATNV